MRNMGRKGQLPPLPQPSLDYISLRGGLDLMTPPWELSPGFLRESENFEIPPEGGYEDHKGYEAFDGKAKPSAATFARIDITITGSFAAGDAITQLVSAATANVVAVDTTTTAPQSYIIVTNVSGTFNDSNDIQVGGITQGTPDSATITGGASTRKLVADYTNLAADYYRALIAAVPGSGKIRGIWNLDDTIYAVRDNAGGTAAVIHEATGSGWASVALGRELAYTSGGSYDVQEGNTITGEISGATAVITRNMLTSGSTQGEDAAGKFIFASQTGTFQAETVKVGASLNVATIAGDSSAITLSPGGKFDIYEHNFGGNSGVKRIYGCDGVNRGFEFDGDVFCPIDTGMTTDKPKHVVVHKEHLFFSFSGSAQHSGINKPYIWSPIFGAGELATGDTITGFKTEPGVDGNSTLGIYNLNEAHMLYGSSALDWNLVQYREEVGALDWTIQTMAQTVFVSDFGITSLRVAQEYGNFLASTLTQRVQDFIDSNKSAAISSCIMRQKNQYRVFFSNKRALYLTFNGNKLMGCMPQLLDHTVEVISSHELNNGNEEVYFGSDDGFVYQMEKGTSFNGEPISAYLKLHYWHSKLLRWIKKYLDCTLEATGSGYTEYTFGYELSYGSMYRLQPSAVANTLALQTSPTWDVAGDTWDVGFWDGSGLLPAVHKMKGSGENVSLVLRTNNEAYATIRFTGAFLRFLRRRQKRQ